MTIGIYRKCLIAARDELLRSLEHVKDVTTSKQFELIARTNIALNAVDSTIEALAGKLPKGKRVKDPLVMPYPEPQALMNEIWNTMCEPDATEYKLMVNRLEPQLYQEAEIAGYLETFFMPITIPEIIEDISLRYGGGKYQIRIVSDTGKYVKSKSFKVSGDPLITDATQARIKHQNPETTNMYIKKVRDKFEKKIQD